MFSTTSEWKKIPCPAGDQCVLINCIFLHKSAAVEHVSPSVPATDTRQGSTKRQRVDSPPQRNKLTTATLLKPKTPNFVGGLIRANAVPRAIEPDNLSNPSNEAPGDRPLSPPPLRTSRTSGIGSTKIVKPTKEIFRPRKVAKDPVPIMTRSLYLSKLRDEMLRLNALTVERGEPSGAPAQLASAQIEKLAMDEEQAIALAKGAIYANAIKLRIVAYKKMPLASWIAERLQVVEKPLGQARPMVDNFDRPLNNGLGQDEEIEIVRRLIAHRNGLEQHGYVIAVPSDADIKSARKRVEDAQNWEQCERCGARFQVFPQRRDVDGALTTGGPCTYHHGRIIYQTSTSAEGKRERVHGCCGEPLAGSRGCIAAKSHVFKVHDSDRLASIMQFETTPENSSVVALAPVCFDCEMAFTTNGLELVRLTALSWPSGQELLDVLVRPLGHILDLNTRYSGITPEMFADAVPWTSETEQPIHSCRLSSFDNSTRSEGTRGLKVVGSPQIARQLLFNVLTPSTPLLGHAIENDLNATRIIHPCIVDTVILFPHEGGPLPLRKSLKVLARQFLHREVQAGGEAGHDSSEDARTTGDLVRLKVGRTWNEMEKSGWRIHDGKLKPPALDVYPLKDSTEYDISRKRHADGIDHGHPDSPGR